MGAWRLRWPCPRRCRKYNSKELHREDVSFPQPFSRRDLCLINTPQRCTTRCLGMITVDLDDAFTGLDLY